MERPLGVAAENRTERLDILWYSILISLHNTFHTAITHLAYNHTFFFFLFYMYFTDAWLIHNAFDYRVSDVSPETAVLTVPHFHLY